MEVVLLKSFFASPLLLSRFSQSSFNFLYFYLSIAIHIHIHIHPASSYISYLFYSRVFPHRLLQR